MERVCVTLATKDRTVMRYVAQVCGDEVVHNNASVMDGERVTHLTASVTVTQVTREPLVIHSVTRTSTGVRTVRIPAPVMGPTVTTGTGRADVLPVKRVIIVNLVVMQVTLDSSVLRYVDVRIMQLATRSRAHVDVSRAGLDSSVINHVLMVTMV